MFLFNFFLVKNHDNIDARKVHGKKKWRARPTGKVDYFLGGEIKSTFPVGHDFSRGPGAVPKRSIEIYFVRAQQPFFNTTKVYIPKYHGTNQTCPGRKPHMSLEITLSYDKISNKKSHFT